MLSLNSNLCTSSGPSWSKWYHWSPRIRWTGEGEYLAHFNCVIFIIFKGRNWRQGNQRKSRKENKRNARSKGITVCHESFKAEKFRVFHTFLHVHETFLYENSRWHCSNMDLTESMRDSTKVFCEDLHVQLAMKLFYLTLSWYMYMIL